MHSETSFFESVPTPRISVVGEQKLFPVGRVFCVGRNYAEHAREMGNDPDREPPFFFMKMSDAIVPGGGEVSYPMGTTDLHHEVELVVALGKGGESIRIEHARDYIFGYAVGLDLTRRDLQASAKKMGRPWDFGKSFAQSAPISSITPANVCGDLSGRAITLSVNNIIKQQGTLDDMIWDVCETISYLSNFYRLRAGDLIFTGTPAGVGALQRGDKLLGSIDGLEPLTVDII